MRNLMLKGYVKALKARQGDFSREEGQGAVEYALVLAFVSLGILVILVGIGTGAVQAAVTAVADFDGT